MSNIKISPSILSADFSRLAEQIEDAEKADEIFTLLMGNKVEPRKEFIEKYIVFYLIIYCQLLNDIMTVNAVFFT